MSMTKTTLDQKTARIFLKKYGPINLEPLTIQLLRYFATNCYWLRSSKDGKDSFRDRRDFEVSLPAIATHLGCAEKTALRHIGIAEQKGLITVNRREEGKNSYSLHLVPMKEWTESKVLQAQKRKQSKAANVKRQQKWRSRADERKQEEIHELLVEYAQQVQQ